MSRSKFPVGSVSTPAPALSFGRLKNYASLWLFPQTQLCLERMQSKPIFQPFSLQRPSLCVFEPTLHPRLLLSFRASAANSRSWPRCTRSTARGSSPLCSASLSTATSGSSAEATCCAWASGSTRPRAGTLVRRAQTPNPRKQAMLRVSFANAGSLSLKYRDTTNA